MPYINPYIEKVEKHPHIWIDEEKMKTMKGKWRGFFVEQKIGIEKEKGKQRKLNITPFLKGDPAFRREGDLLQIHNKSSVLRDASDTSFEKEAYSKLMVEIGTGMGNFFSTYATEHPDTACVGIEIKYKRLHRTYGKCEQKGRGDVILLKVRGEEIANIFGPAEIDELYLLFSDPWPKKGHHKHRIIQDDFLRAVASVLAPEGIFLIKTDDASYATWIEEHLMRNPDFIFEKTSNEDPGKRPSPENSTEFETMVRKEGNTITSFLCRKK